MVLTNQNNKELVWSKLQTTLRTFNGSDKNLLLSEINPNPIDNEDFKELILVLSANFGVDYSDQNNTHFAKASLIMKYANENNYSKQELKKSLNKFIMTYSYPQFQIGNFFKLEDRNYLHNDSWKKSELEKNPNAINDMECFVYLKTKIRLYRYFDIDNPKIDNPDLKCHSSAWDIGKLYDGDYYTGPAKEREEVYGLHADVEQHGKLMRRLIESKNNADIREQNRMMKIEIEKLKSKIEYLEAKLLVVSQ